MLFRSPSIRLAAAPGRNRTAIKVPLLLVVKGKERRPLLPAIALQHGEQHMVTPFAIDAQVFPREAFFLKAAF